MRILIGLSLSLLIATPAWATGTATTASKVFAAVSPSIVVMEAFDAKGHAVALGSGVVIAKGVVVSNCHVFEEAGTQTASVFYQKKRLPAKLRYGDPTHDLCSFTVKGLTAPPVKMGATAALQVGENAYAIGAPEGLDLTLSTGVVSSLRKIPGGVVIQTTAAISPGSSGGGLFDSQGRLIGITSYYEKEGQQLNFALPVEWVKALPQRGKTLKELASQPAKFRANFQQGVKAYLSGDYPAAFSIFLPLAKGGNAAAQYYLGQVCLGKAGETAYKGCGDNPMYWSQKSAEKGNIKAQAFLGFSYLGFFGGRDYSKALKWNLKAAEQGDASAEAWLGYMYRNGLGVSQDYPKAAYWYRKAAVQKLDDAQYNLGRMYENGEGVSQDYTKALYWYHKAANQGESSAQYAMGRMYHQGIGVAKDYAKAIYWYRKSAEQEESDAQVTLGLMYYLGQAVPQDYVQATKWIILAKAEGDKGADKLLSGLEQKMTSVQIAEAQKMAGQWWEAHHKQ